jgi:hypothetical protein
VAALAVEWEADWVALSYRLTPEVGKHLFLETAQELRKAGISPVLTAAGTVPVAQAAKETGLFQKVFATEGASEVMAWLRGDPEEMGPRKHPDDLISRVDQSAPYPILRHHLGLPSLEKTREAAGEIALAEVLDVLSLAPDQNGQQYFFDPSKMDPALNGAGGCPFRTPEDLRSLYEATRCGNFPLLRCYAGTTRLLEYASLLRHTLNNAWGAIPISWYSSLDGRSPRLPERSIPENFAAMKWHAQQGIPLEINEPHQWGLRGAHDALFVAAGAFSARTAKALGIRTYVAQMMLNTPGNVSPRQDVAKMLAYRELVEELESPDFRVLVEVRPGLLGMPSDLCRAKGQLAHATALGMQLSPDILHVVAYCEAEYAAGAKEIIESCGIARQVMENCLLGDASYGEDQRVLLRKEQLLKEARLLLAAVASCAPPETPDPFGDPQTYVNAIRRGILDAPGLQNGVARGEILTDIRDGACVVLGERGEILTEEERLIHLLGKEAVEQLPTLADEEYRKKQIG